VLVYAIAPISLAMLLLNDHEGSREHLLARYLAEYPERVTLSPSRTFPSNLHAQFFEGTDLPKHCYRLRRFKPGDSRTVRHPFKRVSQRAILLGRSSQHGDCLIAMPERKRYGWIVAGLRVSVAIATIYGRYIIRDGRACGPLRQFFRLRGNIERRSAIVY